MGIVGIKSSMEELGLFLSWIATPGTSGSQKPLGEGLWWNKSLKVWLLCSNKFSILKPLFTLNPNSVCADLDLGGGYRGKLVYSEFYSVFYSVFYSLFYSLFFLYFIGDDSWSERWNGALWSWQKWKRRAGIGIVGMRSSMEGLGWFLCCHHPWLGSEVRGCW